jgi:DNA-binding NarL/FixJ family response regulator
MKKHLLICLILFLPGTLVSLAQYSDHRGHQLDSLEHFVLDWTPEKLESADDGQCTAIIQAYGNLMYGYSQINPDRGMYYARKALELGTRKDWLWRMVDANRMLGQYHYGGKQYDSAFYYYNAARDVIARMPGRYQEQNIDDISSQLYGSIGNLYSVMDSLPQAMEYYEKAGAIFEKYGWKENSSVLYHNMGETWLEKGHLAEAEECYDKALRYGQEAQDSLMIANAKAGLGALCLEQGKTGKALQYLQEADVYFSTHDDQEYRSRLYTLDLTGKVLAAQKRQIRAIATGAILLSLALIALVVVLLRTRRLRKENEAANEVIGQALENGSARIDLEENGQLTDREKEILPLLAAGLTSPQIADKLYLSLPTIKWYRRRLLERFDAKNTAGMISKAREQGVL